MSVFSILKRLFNRSPGRVADASLGLGLGVEGLPASLQRFPPCQAQVLMVQEKELRQRLLCLVVQTTLERGLPLHVVLGPGAVDELESCLELSPDLARAVEGGRVQLIEWLSASRGSAALLPLLKELHLFQVAPEDGLIFLGMETLLDWERPGRLQQQLATLQKWVRQRPAGTLFLFTGNGPEALPVASIDWAFPNVGKLAWVQAHLSLEILRWQGGLLNNCYGLQLAGQRLGMEGSVLDGERQRLLAAPRQGNVLAMANALAGQAGVPAHWQLLADAAALEQELPTLGAATLLLAYEGRDDFVSLVHQVHRLRQAHPRHLKILVRETGAKLRYGAESILLKAGINGVIYRELGFSRAIQQVHGYSDQIYNGEPCSGLDELLAAAEPDPLAGYLPPAEFCQRVRRMVEQSSLLGMEHCLLRFSLLRRLTLLDALEYCRIGRHGDLITTDREHIYLFLFACREPDVDASVNHIFLEPVDTLFKSTWIYPGSDLILHALEHLEQQAEHEALPDHSALLAARLAAQALPWDRDRVGPDSPVDLDALNLPENSPVRTLLAQTAGALQRERPAWPQPRQVRKFSLAALQ